MKKLFLLSAVVAATMAVTSCSSDKEVDPGNDITQVFNADGEAFVNISINLPTSNGTTRANGVYDDGEPSEYKVNDAILILFAGDTESTATFKSAYKLGDLTGGNPVPYTTEITQTQSIVQDGINPSDNLFAYVVLNGVKNTYDNGGTDTPFFTVNNDHSLKVHWSTGDVTYTTSSSTNFSNFSTQTLNDIGDNTEGFIMTNAPLWKGHSGGESDPGTGSIVSLAKIPRDRIYSTKALAESNPATNIYVERAAVKVQVTTDETAATTVEGTNLKWVPNSINWTIDNVNNVYYNVRRLSEINTYKSYYNVGEYYLNSGTGTAAIAAPTGASKYRFIDAISTGGLGTEADPYLYRVFWAEDANMNTVPNVTTKATAVNTPIKTGDKVNSLYTFENTVDADHMYQKNTTRAIVAVKFQIGDATAADFYTTDVYGTGKGFKTGTTGEGTLAQQLAVYLKQMPAVFKWLTDNIDSNKYDEALKAVVTSITFNNNTNAGTATVDAVTLDNTKVTAAMKKTGVTDVTAFDASLATAAAAYLNNNVKITYYKDGIAYYPVRIKHFGDSETPWDADHKEGSAYDYVYPANLKTAMGYPDATTRAQQWLGRYGVVRNNWYILDISDVKKIGSPTIPDIPADTPDDEIDQYLSVKINVTRWSVRKQTVTL